MTRVLKLIAIVVVLAFSSLLCVYASVPPMISYQGKLMQPSGAAVPDGTYSIQFAIYDVPTGGTALWSETNSSVQVKGGLFAVMLGSINNLPSNIFDSPSRFFGVKVGSDPEMTPRQQIASSAFSFRSAIAGTVDDGAITASKLADGAVTAEKIADNSIAVTKLLSGIAVPTGSIIEFAGSTPPTGWLLCDGSEVSRTTYSDLFTAIGTTYGSGDGSTTFNLPNLQGKVPVGQDNESEFAALGQTGGEKTHTLTIAEMPSHRHGMTMGVVGTPELSTGTYNAVFIKGDYSTASTGGDQPHNNLQPYIVLNYIIKY